jgi:hypothetical protein
MRRAVYVSPAELLDNPRNLRTNLSDLDDLKASIGTLRPCPAGPCRRGSVAVSEAEPRASLVKSSLDMIISATRSTGAE